jgi:V-type H+-transporting ATPase subunit G
MKLTQSLGRAGSSADCPERYDEIDSMCWTTTLIWRQHENVNTPPPPIPQPSDSIDRTKKVKDARNEAQKEIEEYRQGKEEEFKKFEKEVGSILQTQQRGMLTSPQHSSGNKKAEEDAGKAAEEQVKEIDDIGKKHGQKVVDQLLAAVTDVKPEPPRSAT